MGVPLVSCNCLVQVEKGSGDRSKGCQVHGIGLFSCGMQSHFQQLIGFLRALYVTLELSVVEGLKDFAFLRMRLSLEEFLEAKSQPLLKGSAVAREILGKDAGGLHEGGIIEKIKSLLWGIGALPACGTFLPWGSIKCNEHGMQEASLPMHVNPAAILILVVMLLIGPLWKVQFTVVTRRLVGSGACTANRWIQQARHCEGIVADKFCRQSAGILPRIEAVVGIRSCQVPGSVGGLLVGFGGEDQFDKVLDIPVALHELDRQPVKQLRMSGPLALISEVLQVAR